MTGNFEAADQDQSHSTSPDIATGQGDVELDPVTYYRCKFAKLQREAQPKLKGSRCATCIVADPSKNAFFGLDERDTDPRMARDRYGEYERRLGEAVAGRCVGRIDEQQELVTYQEEVIPPPPKQSKIMKIVRALAPKIGIPVRPIEKPEPITVTRNIILISPPHCGQDAPLYQQHYQGGLTLRGQSSIISGKLPKTATGESP